MISYVPYKSRLTSSELQDQKEAACMQLAYVATNELCTGT